MASVTIDL